MRFIIVCILFISFTFHCFSQTIENIQFKHFNTENGISNNWIRCIFQDDYGYMWFGTSDGLNRFDAYDFKTYRPKSSDSNNISDVNVNAIKSKNKNELWVCTDLGVYIYDYYNDKLKPFSQLQNRAVLSILVENDSIIWFGSTTELIRLNSNTNYIEYFRNNVADNKTVSNNYIQVLFKDSRSNIWIGTQGGLNIKYPESKEFIRIASTKIENNAANLQVLSICEDRRNNIWVGTSQNGILRLVCDAGGNYSLTQYENGNIQYLMIDYQNNLWFANDSENGLGVFSLNRISNDEPEYLFFRHNLSDAESISDNFVSCIYEDKFNDIWIGTLSGGINYFSKRLKQFHVVNNNSNIRNTISNNHVNAFFEEEKYLWVGTEGGLERYDKKTGLYKHFKFNPDNPKSLGGNSVYSICKDSGGNLWIGCWNGGLNLYSYASESFTRIQINGKTNENIFSICEDGGNYLWIGTLGNGLYRYDYSTGLFKNFQPSEGQSNSLYSKNVNHILITSDKRLLISTYNTVDEYNYKSEDFSHLYFSTDSLGNDQKKHIISIFEDSRKNTWIATNKGLELLDQPIKYTVADGLPDNVIQAVTEDSKGNLWISTTKGISKFVNGTSLPKSPVFENYIKHDGLPGNEFIKRAVFNNSAGIIYFGSSEGYTFFQSDSIFKNEVVPRVVLTDFHLLSSKPDEIRRYQPIDKNIDRSDELELSYKNSDFIISFSVLNYLNAEKNLYQYMLKGYDKEWIDAGTNRKATYTNIQPGRYIFLVRGSNNDGVWCESPKMLNIIIHPPWWRTILFKVLLTVTLIAILYLLYRMRLSNLKHQKKMLEETVSERTRELSEMNVLLEERQEEIIVQNNELENHRNNLEGLIEERTKELVQARLKAEESDRLKSAFLANMSHEIRTPMNAIIGFTELLDDESLTDEEKKVYLKTINSNSEALLVLINDIIDISLIEANQLKLQNRLFNAVTILSELEYYYELKKSDFVDIEFEKFENSLMINTDQIRFRQILTNLINNAIKFTEHGSIKFGYTSEANLATFYVSDTGIGISESEKPKIFNHFHKVDLKGDKMYRGAGIGLSICKKLVELMGGRIWVTSDGLSGSVFYFTLPLNTDVLSQPEITKQKSKIPDIDLEGYKIIIAEDDETNYKLLKRILQKSKAEISWMTNGKEVVDYVVSENNQIANNCLILMDIKMPVMDGIEACKKVKEIHPDIPIIAITAYGYNAEQIGISFEQFDGFIPKPISKEALFTLINKNLKR